MCSSIFYITFIKKNVTSVYPTRKTCFSSVRIFRHKFEPNRKVGNSHGRMLRSKLEYFEGILQFGQPNYSRTYKQGH